MKKLLIPFASLLLATPVFSQCPEDRCTSYLNRSCEGVMASGTVELSLHSETRLKVTENDGFTIYDWYMQYFCDQDSLSLELRPVLYGPCQAEEYIVGYGLLKEGYIELHEWRRPFYETNNPGVWTCRQWVTEEYLLSQQTALQEEENTQHLDVSENVLYPNPAKGEFTLNPDRQWNFPLEVSCIDMRGQVLQKWILQRSDFPSTVDASMLAPGCYLIELKDSVERRSIHRLVLN